MPDWLSRLLPWLNPPRPAAPKPPSPVTSPTPGQLDRDWLRALNAERAKVGLIGMVTDPLLTDSAQAWAESMAANGQLQHGNFVGRIESVHPNTAASEDIAEGQVDVAGVCAAWMASPPHRANILGNFNRTGIGMALGANRVCYWVSDFVMVA